MRRHALCLALALLAFAPFFALAAPPAQTPDAIDIPADAIPSVATFGAKGDGVTDDTAAIQAALDAGRRNPNGSPVHDDFFGRPKALFFPPGVYLVSKTLDWAGCCLTLQGAGSGRTTLRLRDSAPGFGDPAAPKPVLRTPAGNMSFRQNVRDLAIDTGSGNPGAVGLDFIANNSGAVVGVVIRSGDGRGVRGLDLTRQWPGPALFKDLRVEGFDVGIAVRHAEYGPTFEQITLRGQRVAGIENRGNTLAIRGLSSANSVPAIVSAERWSSLILLDVCIEELNVSALAKTKLSKSVLDAAWAMLREQLEYKALWRGKRLTTIGRFFPSSRLCPNCGTINQELTLSDRAWTCACGVTHDRDCNAARNIRTEGLRLLLADGSSDSLNASGAPVSLAAGKHSAMKEEAAPLAVR